MSAGQDCGEILKVRAPAQQLRVTGPSMGAIRVHEVGLLNQLNRSGSGQMCVSVNLGYIRHPMISGPYRVPLLVGKPTLLLNCSQSFHFPILVDSSDFSTVRFIRTFFNLSVLFRLLALYEFSLCLALFSTVHAVWCHVQPQHGHLRQFCGHSRL